MGRPRKYTLNENYFDNITSSNQAYILGFIYADGSINLNKNTLSICISEKDKSILEFIIKELEYSGNIKLKIIKNNKYSLLTIVSKKLINRLNELGIIQNKTYNSKNLPKISKSLFNDLLRGFFDGDGSIYKNSNIGYSVCFSSNIYILKIIKKYLENKLIKSSNIRFRNKNSIYSGMLEIRGNNQIIKLYNLLYSDVNNFKLERKFNIFLEFNNYINNLSKRNISSETINKIKNLYFKKITQKEIHIILNIPYPTIRGVVQRLRNKNKL